MNVTTLLDGDTVDERYGMSIKQSLPWLSSEETGFNNLILEVFPSQREQYPWLSGIDADQYHWRLSIWSDSMHRLSCDVFIPLTISSEDGEGEDNEGDTFLYTSTTTSTSAYDGLNATAENKKDKIKDRQLFVFDLSAAEESLAQALDGNNEDARTNPVNKANNRSFNDIFLVLELLHKSSGVPLSRGSLICHPNFDSDDDTDHENDVHAASSQVMNQCYSCSIGMKMIANRKLGVNNVKFAKHKSALLDASTEFSFDCILSFVRKPSKIYQWEGWHPFYAIPCYAPSPLESLFHTLSDHSMFVMPGNQIMSLESNANRNSTVLHLSRSLRCYLSVDDMRVSSDLLELSRADRVLISAQYHALGTVQTNLDASTNLEGNETLTDVDTPQVSPSNARSSLNAHTVFLGEMVTGSEAEWGQMCEVTMPSSTTEVTQINLHMLGILLEESENQEDCKPLSTELCGGVLDISCLEDNTTKDTVHDNNNIGTENESPRLGKALRSGIYVVPLYTVPTRMSVGQGKEGTEYAPSDRLNRRKSFHLSGNVEFQGVLVGEIVVKVAIASDTINSGISVSNALSPSESNDSTALPRSFYAHRTFSKKLVKALSTYSPLPLWTVSYPVKGGKMMSSVNNYLSMSVTDIIVTLSACAQRLLYLKSIGGIISPTHHSHSNSNTSTVQGDRSASLAELRDGNLEYKSALFFVIKHCFSSLLQQKYCDNCTFQALVSGLQQSHCLSVFWNFFQCWLNSESAEMVLNIAGGANHSNNGDAEKQHLHMAPELMADLRVVCWALKVLHHSGFVPEAPSEDIPASVLEGETPVVGKKHTHKKHGQNVPWGRSARMHFSAINNHTEQEFDVDEPMTTRDLDPTHTTNTDTAGFSSNNSTVIHDMMHTILIFADKVLEGYIEEYDFCYEHVNESKNSYQHGTSVGSSTTKSNIAKIVFELNVEIERERHEVVLLSTQTFTEALGCMSILVDCLQDPTSADKSSNGIIDQDILSIFDSLLSNYFEVPFNPHSAIPIKATGKAAQAISTRTGRDIVNEVGTALNNLSLLLSHLVKHQDTLLDELGSHCEASWLHSYTYKHWKAQNMFKHSQAKNDAGVYRTKGSSSQGLGASTLGDTQGGTNQLIEPSKTRGDFLSSILNRCCAFIFHEYIHDCVNNDTLLSFHHLCSCLYHCFEKRLKHHMEAKGISNDTTGESDNKTNGKGRITTEVTNLNRILPAAPRRKNRKPQHLSHLDGSTLLQSNASDNGFAPTLDASRVRDENVSKIRSVLPVNSSQDGHSFGITGAKMPDNGSHSALHVRSFPQEPLYGFDAILYIGERVSYLDTLLCLVASSTARASENNRSRANIYQLNAGVSFTRHLITIVMNSIFRYDISTLYGFEEKKLSERFREYADEGGLLGSCLIRCLTIVSKAIKLYWTCVLKLIQTGQYSANAVAANGSNPIYTTNMSSGAENEGIHSKSDTLSLADRLLRDIILMENMKDILFLHATADECLSVKEIRAYFNTKNFVPALQATTNNGDTERDGLGRSNYTCAITTWLSARKSFVDCLASVLYCATSLNLLSGHDEKDEDIGINNNDEKGESNLGSTTPKGDRKQFKERIEGVKKSAKNSTVTDHHESDDDENDTAVIDIDPSTAPLGRLALLLRDLSDCHVILKERPDIVMLCLAPTDARFVFKSIFQAILHLPALGDKNNTISSIDLLQDLGIKGADGVLVDSSMYSWLSGLDLNIEGGNGKNLNNSNESRNNVSLLEKYIPLLIHHAKKDLLLALMNILQILAIHKVYPSELEDYMMAVIDYSLLMLVPPLVRRNPESSIAIILGQGIGQSGDMFTIDISGYDVKHLHRTTNSIDSGYMSDMDIDEIKEGVKTARYATLIQMLLELFNELSMEHYPALVPLYRRLLYRVRAVQAYVPSKWNNIHLAEVGHDSTADENKDDNVDTRVSCTLAMQVDSLLSAAALQSLLHMAPSAPSEDLVSTPEGVDDGTLGWYLDSESRQLIIAEICGLSGYGIGSGQGVHQEDADDINLRLLGQNTDEEEKEEKKERRISIVEQVEAAEKKEHRLLRQRLTMVPDLLKSLNNGHLSGAKLQYLTLMETDHFHFDLIDAQGTDNITSMSVGGVPGMTLGSTRTPVPHVSKGTGALSPGGTLSPTRSVSSTIPPTVSTKANNVLDPRNLHHFELEIGQMRSVLISLMECGEWETGIHLAQSLQEKYSVEEAKLRTALSTKVKDNSSSQKMMDVQTLHHYYHLQLKRMATLKDELSNMLENMKHLLVHDGESRCYPSYYAIRFVGNPFTLSEDKTAAHEGISNNTGNGLLGKDMNTLLQVAESKLQAFEVLGVSDGIAEGLVADTVEQMDDFFDDVEVGMDNFNMDSSSPRAADMIHIGAEGVQEGTTPKHHKHAAGSSSNSCRGTWLMLKYDATAYPKCGEAYKSWSADIGAYMPPEYDAHLPTTATTNATVSATQVEVDEKEDPVPTSGGLADSEPETFVWNYQRPGVPPPSSSYIVLARQLQLAYPNIQVLPGTDLLEPLDLSWCEGGKGQSFVQIFPAYPSSLCDPGDFIISKKKKVKVSAGRGRRSIFAGEDEDDDNDDSDDSDDSDSDDDFDMRKAPAEKIEVSKIRNRDLRKSVSANAFFGSAKDGGVQTGSGNNNDPFSSFDNFDDYAHSPQHRMHNKLQSNTDSNLLVDSSDWEKASHCDKFYIYGLKDTHDISGSIGMQQAAVKDRKEYGTVVQRVTLECISVRNGVNLATPGQLSATPALPSYKYDFNDTNGKTGMDQDEYNTSNNNSSSWSGVYSASVEKIHSLSPAALVFPSEVVSMTAFEAAYETIIYQYLCLKTLREAITKCADVTNAELRNQSSRDLLSNNGIMAAVTSTFSNILTKPASCSIGLANSRVILAGERERIESLKQLKRKLMKREYLANVKEYESLLQQGYESDELEKPELDIAGLELEFKQESKRVMQVHRLRHVCHDLIKDILKSFRLCCGKLILDQQQSNTDDVEEMIRSTNQRGGAGESKGGSVEGSEDGEEEEEEEEEEANRVLGMDEFELMWRQLALWLEASYYSADIGMCV